MAWLLPAGIFPSSLLDGVGRAVWGQGTGWAPWPRHPLSRRSVGAVPPAPRFPPHPASSPWHLPAAGARGEGGQGPWVALARGQSPGPPPHTHGSAATSATETLRRVGAARSHLPLIEFICHNPKQCKAGFSQAPAACLPIKIPSRTANPPSRLDIKQPVSKKQQAKPPCARVDPLLPVPVACRAPGPFPGGSRGNKGSCRAAQRPRLRAVPSSGSPSLQPHGKDGLSPILPTSVFQAGFQAPVAGQDPALSLGLSLLLAGLRIPKLPFC